MTEALFANRTPEAAARQCAIVLASATEWHLATLERLRSRKSSAKYDVARLDHICAQLVEQCRDLGVPTRGLRGSECTRLAASLASPGSKTA